MSEELRGAVRLIHATSIVRVGLSRRSIAAQIAVLGAVTALAAACHDPANSKASPERVADSTAPTPTPSAAATSTHDTTDAAPVTPEERLAFAATGSTSPIDAEIDKAQTVARHNPDKSDAFVVLGRFWVKKARETADPGFYVNADACATIALRLAPDSGPAEDLRSLVLLNDHRFEEARALAQRTVTAHPEDPMGYGSLSDALLELGRFDEGAAAVQRMVDIKPNLASYSRASYIDWLRGDVPGALEAARLAVDSGGDPKDPEPRAWELVQAALIFWHRGDYAGADAGFESARERGLSEYPPALVGKGRVALAKGDGKRAAELFDRAYAHSPLVMTAWLLGDARAMAGDKDGAEKAYALVEKEGKRTDKRTLSLYYSTKNVKPDQALALIEAEKKTRGDLYTDDAYAWALHRNGRDADARVASDHALSHGTKDASLLFHSGAIRIALKDVAAGRKRVADALALNPNFDVTGSEEARGLLGLAAGDGGAR